MCDLHGPACRCDEELVFQIDPESGIGGWYPRRTWRDTLWVAPFVGLWEFVSDYRRGRLTTADWVFLAFVAALIIRGS